MPRAPRPRGKITIRDVATFVGVTPMTVSNVLNRRPGAVAPETTQRVLDAIGALGYQPSAHARRLRHKQTHTIGMLLLDRAPDFLRDPFTTNIVAGLGNTATEHGRSLILQGLRTSMQEGVSLLSHVETDGICVLTSGAAEDRQALFARLLQLRQPLVIFQELFRAEDVCCIRQDDRGGGRMIARYLIDRGARRLHMLVPETEWPGMVEREGGVRDVALEAGATVLPVRCGDEGMSDTAAAVAAAIAAHGLPDAIVGGNDRMAIAALKVLAERGVAVPERVRVTGFNAFEFAQYATPALTTVRSAAYDLGRRGGEALLARIRDGAFAAAEIVIPVSVVLGASA